MAEAQLTPMMAQYRRIKSELPKDALLFFRLGDFYEMFFEDAKAASILLNVALTKRNSVPMCGVPYHAAPNYIAKLIKAGRRVAKAEIRLDASDREDVDQKVHRVEHPSEHRCKERAALDGRQGPDPVHGARR